MTIETYSIITGCLFLGALIASMIHGEDPTFTFFQHVLGCFLIAIIWPITVPTFFFLMVLRINYAATKEALKG